MIQPKITIHCFVYKGDDDIIQETVMCAKQALPDAHMVVIDDQNDPCSLETRASVEKLGAEWRCSTWNRGGNLRGKPCITGILSEMITSSTSDNDVLIKIDADTCIMDGDEILEFSKQNQKILCAAGERDVRIYGLCYCIRAHAVKKTLEYLNEIDIPNHAAEDVVINFAVCTLFPDPSLHLIHKTDEAGTKWTAYSWWNYPSSKGYRGKSVITVGNGPPAPLSKKQRRPMMRNLRLEAASYLKEKLNNKKS